MEYKFTNGKNPDFAYLCQELDKSLDEIVAGRFDRSQYCQYNQLNNIHDVIIVYDGSKPIGCASYKKYDLKIAEIKRVFIKPEYRGQGISKIMLRKLEENAKSNGFMEFILETGELLAASMKLYKSIGYKITPNYGPYIGMKDSICMRKTL